MMTSFSLQSTRRDYVNRMQEKEELGSAIIQDASKNVNRFGKNSLVTEIR